MARHIRRSHCNDGEGTSKEAAQTFEAASFLTSPPNPLVSPHPLTLWSHLTP